MKTALDVTKDLAQILSWVAVPLILAVLGWQIQDALKEKELRRDYVQIAVGILSTKDGDTDLRAWATEVLQANSPIALGEGVRGRLAVGTASLSGIPKWPRPAADLMEPVSTGADVLRRVSEELEALGNDLSKWQLDVQGYSTK